VAHTAENRKVDFNGKPEGKKPLKRPRQRWEDIKILLKVTG